jgi:outer membrane protein OmpA-like peptidoglycan-associated protein
MRVRLYPATDPVARKTAGSAVPARRPDALIASTLAISMVLALAPISDVQARNRVTIDDSVLDELGPEPTIASLLARTPRGQAIAATPSLTNRLTAGALAARSVAQAPAVTPRSRLIAPGGTQGPAAPPVSAAAAPILTPPAPSALRLPPMTAVAAAPSLRSSPAEAPRSRLLTAPVLKPVLTRPAAEPTQQIALAPPPALLLTPPVAPFVSGLRPAPAQAPRSQLTLPPSLGERVPLAAAPSLTPPVAPAPVPSSSWPSLTGAAVAAPLSPIIAAPPVSPATSGVGGQARQVAAPTARDIQPPAPLAAPVAAPSAAPSASAVKSQVILTRLLFQRGTMDPADGSREALVRLAEQLVAAPTRRIEIQAYSAGAGRETENSNEARRMSLDRALAVRSGLVQRGVQSNRVTVRSLGNVGGEGPPDRVDIVLLGE